MKDEKSKIVAGMINTANNYQNSNVNVADIEASQGGRAILGIAEGVPLGTFFD